MEKHHAKAPSSRLRRPCHHRPRLRRRIAVVYFTKTGNTKSLAEAVRHMTGAALFRVETVRALSGKLWFRHRDREGRAPARRHPSDQAARLQSRRLRRSRARHAHVVAPRGDAAADLDQVRRPQRQEDPHRQHPRGPAASCTPARPSRRCSQAAGSARTSRSTGPCARRTQRSGKRLSLTPETQSRTGIRHGED